MRISVRQYLLVNGVLRSTANHEQLVLTGLKTFSSCYSPYKLETLNVRPSVWRRRPAGKLQRCTTEYEQLVLIGLMRLAAAVAPEKAAGLKNKPESK